MKWDYLPRVCQICGNTEWFVIDNKSDYSELCTTCNDVRTLRGFKTINTFRRTECINNFECPECGSLKGTPEENTKKFGIRCSNCNKLTIFLLKNPINLDFSTINNNTAKITCPKCGSTNITTGARGINWTWGLIGASKTVNRCGNCGYSWTPKKR